MVTRVTGPVALVAAVGLALPGAATAQGAPQAPRLLEAARFAPAHAPTAAVSYDAALVPPGASVVVRQWGTEDGGTAVAVAVAGLVPGHTYGTHVHTGECGADPAAAGGHYRHLPEPAGPENELWLDLTADAYGAGRAEAEVDWTFRPGGARSVVLHERATSHGHDGHDAGYAGERVACFTVPFAGADGA